VIRADRGRNVARASLFERAATAAAAEMTVRFFARFKRMLGARARISENAM